MTSALSNGSCRRGTEYRREESRDSERKPAWARPSRGAELGSGQGPRSALPAPGSQRPVGVAASRDYPMNPNLPINSHRFRRTFVERLQDHARLTSLVRFISKRLQILYTSSQSTTIRWLLSGSCAVGTFSSCESRHSHILTEHVDRIASGSRRADEEVVLVIRSARLLPMPRATLHPPHRMTPGLRSQPSRVPSRLTDTQTVIGST